jgi:elongation of very long chain fatty acids protein 4
MLIEAYPRHSQHDYTCTHITILIASIFPSMLNSLSPKGPDPVTHTWLLCGSPWPILLITFGYILSIPYGKQWMSTRAKPFEIRLPMVIYNMLAIAVNAYVVLLAGRTVILKSYRIYCQGVMHDPEDMYLARAVWLYFLSKAFEFWDTWFFILTKKFSHISILHVYHHATMFPMWYLAT